MWFGKKGDKDILKPLLKTGKVFLAREVRYKNSTRNSYQFRVVSRQKLLEMEGNQHLYEVIAYKPGFHAKLYFDLDTGSKKDLKELCHALHDLGVSESIILDACEARLPFPNVVNERILGFLSRKPKFSVHLICNRIYESVYHMQSWLLDVLLIKYPHL